MKRLQLLILAGCMIPAASLFGQAPVPPQPAPAVQQTSFQRPGVHKQQVANYFADMNAARTQNHNIYAGHSVHPQTASAGYHGGYGGYAATCPHGQNCNQCGQCFPRHRYSSAYNVPRHLTYPQQRSTGGVVVYPYYTFKGPSDFFRK